jgi:hypothetical protein
MGKLFSLSKAIDWWAKKSENSVRQSFNVELYMKILKIRGL